jgi:hypothetical protein
MKKIAAIIICIMMLFTTGSVFADEYVTVIMDGETINFDVPARIVNDRTMVPMRMIFEKLGAEVEWIEDDEIVFAVRDDEVITMKINQNYFTVANLLSNETYVKDLDVAPMLVDDRTLVPIRAVSESLNCTVDWVEDTYTVIITTND